MIRLALLVVLAGQSPVGNWLTRPEYQTQAARTFYVDPTGNNANACTASGTAACATLSGVFAKLPPRIVHAQTINVAAGTYTDSPLLSADVGANVSIVGPALANATVSPGAATGTLTSASLNSGPYAVLIDSGQSWAVNALIGQMVVMTSGGSNNIVRVIASNTATTITTSANYAVAPTTSETYAIRTPAAIVSNSATGLTLKAAGLGASAATVSITVTGIDFSGTSTVGCTVMLTNQLFSLTNSKCRSASGQGFIFQGGGQFSATTSTVSGQIGGLRIRTISVGTSPAPTATVNFNASLLYGVDGDGFDMRSGGFLAMAGASNFTAQTGSASSNFGAISTGMTASRSVFSATASVILRCLQVAGPSGILLASLNGAALATTGSFVHDNIWIEGCANGINLGGLGTGIVAASTSVTCANTATCIKVAEGSRVRLPSTFTTDAGVDISIDGVSYTKANLTGSIPTRLPTLAPSLTGSTVWQ